MQAGWFRRLWAAVVLASVLAAAPSLAQQPPGPAEPPATTAPADPRTMRARLDGFRGDLAQRELALANRELGDPELQRYRAQIEPVADAIRGILDELTPRLDAGRARLEQLGPKPKDGQPEESADVARERSEREAAVAELDETLRLGRTLLLQAEQLRTQISDRRRAAFARAVFEQSHGFLSPDLWVEFWQALPRDVRALRTVAADSFERLRRTSSLGALLVLGLAVGLAISLHLGRRYVAPRLVARDPANETPSRRSRLLAAVAILLLGGVPAVAGNWIVWAAFDALDLLAPRVEPVIGAVLRGIALVAFARALADAILAPGHGPWRLVSLSDAGAHRIHTFVLVAGTVLATGKVMESAIQAIAAALPSSVMTRSIFALVFAALLANLLRSFASNDEPEESGAYVDKPEIPGIVRLIGWVAATATIVFVLFGYVALASFVVDQVAWMSVLLALLLLALAVADEFIGATLREESRVSYALQANTGLRRRSLEQIGVLATGVTRLGLILLAILLGLAPWGVESGDVVSSMRAAFFGFRVGDVTISLSSIAIAAFIFGVGFTITRVIQRWLDATFLPATDLDAGLRNSIRTGFGYVGVIVAGAVAFSYLGLSLDRLTIVAGALSVGIGFGLQSIVNNFVSGLILLWERPIRVGDLVVVGDGEGYVRHINVRATEIETFDRSTVLVPNSNLISGIVRNRVRSGRTGRVLVSIPAPRFADPDQIAELMRTAALAHREVMSEPPPRVLFKKVTDTAIEFDLICFVDEIDTVARVASELYFAIYRRLRELGVVPTAPPAAQAHGAAPVDSAKA
jgi:small-conductance mechanosensitive channel